METSFYIFLSCMIDPFFPRQVPSLEHNNQVKGESLDLVKYIDSNFEGPSLLPEVRIHQIAINVALAKNMLFFQAC